MFASILQQSGLIQKEHGEKKKEKKEKRLKQKW